MKIGAPPGGMARLADGRWVRLDSEDWRADCEARLFLSMTQAQRDHHINRVTHFRGEAAATRLWADVAAMEAV